MFLGDVTHGAVGHAGSVGRTPANVFNEIYVVFLGLGTVVGIVVIGYTLYNAVKYRDERDHDERDKKRTDVVRPSLGELPESGGGGRKLFVSFFFSAVIVVSLILWTYSALLYVDAGAGAAAEGGNSEGGIDGLNENQYFTKPLS
jgi:cytochrome c oxidase subunit 2